MTISTFFIILFTFTAIMLLMAWQQKHDDTFKSFFAAGRNVGIWGIAISTSASWQWADNLFSTSQIGYDFGIHGVLWFASASFLSFLIFAWLAEKMRSQAPDILTIPDFVALKTNRSKSVHIAMTLGTILYQLFALALGATVTGLLLNAAFGFDYFLAASYVIVFALTYSLISGLKASVLTDVIQFSLMAVLMGVLIFIVSNGIDYTEFNSALLFGGGQTYTSFWNKDLVLSLGIPLSIIVVAQPIVDQMIFQRLAALDKSINPFKPFLLTGVICAALVILLSSVGFFGQYLVSEGHINVTDSQLVVVEAVRHAMSETGLILFVIAFVGVVFSTTDSIYSSLSALISIDIYKKYFSTNKSEKEIITVARISMFLAGALAIAMSAAKLEILWILFIIGAAGGTIVMPVVFSVFAKSLRARWVLASILLSLVISVPLSIYANVIGDSLLVSVASLMGIVIGAVFCTVAIKETS